MRHRPYEITSRRNYRDGVPVGGGLGQIDCEGCPACCAGMVGGDAGHTDCEGCAVCCAGTVGGDAGQTDGRGGVCSGGVPVFAPTLMRVGGDDGLATATFGLGFGLGLAASAGAGAGVSASASGGG